LLVRHLNKAVGMSAKHHGGGSVAYSALVCSVILAAKITEPSPDGPTYAIAHSVGNLSKHPDSIGYRLDSAPHDPDSPVVTWMGPVKLDAS
jgi:hypothetical protein